MYCGFYIYLKDRVFCDLFPDVVEEIKKDLSETNTAEEATLREEEERLRRFLFVVWF